VDYPNGVGVADRFLLQTISFETAFIVKDLPTDECAALFEWNGCSVTHKYALLIR